MRSFSITAFLVAVLLLCSAADFSSRTETEQLVRNHFDIWRSFYAEGDLLFPNEDSPTSFEFRIYKGKGKMRIEMLDGGAIENGIEAFQVVYIDSTVITDCMGEVMIEPLDDDKRSWTIPDDMIDSFLDANMDIIIEKGYVSLPEIETSIVFTKDYRIHSYIFQNETTVIVKYDENGYPASLDYDNEGENLIMQVTRFVPGLTDVPPYIPGETVE